MLKGKNKAIVLFIVLMTVVLVIVLGNIILGLMFGQNRFTRHKVSRVQAYYAAIAGIRYVEEMLRLGSWPLPESLGVSCTCRMMCRDSSCTSNCPTGCTVDSVSVTDDKLPGSINSIAISVSQTGYGVRTIKASADFSEKQ